MEALLTHIREIASNSYFIYGAISVGVLFFIFNATKRWFWTLVFRLAAFASLGLVVVCVMQERYFALAGCVVSFFLFGWISHEIYTAADR